MESNDLRDHLHRTRDQPIEGDGDRIPVPLEVQHLLKGVCRQGIDLNEEFKFKGDDVGPEDVRAACEHLTQEIQENFESIIMDGEILHRNEFGIYISLPTKAWRDHFGTTPPGSIDDWEPVVRKMREELVVKYQTSMGRWKRDTTIPDRIESFKHASFSFDDAADWPLAIWIDPATEFDKLGLMTIPQALVYILRSYGYTTNEAAVLIEKSPGTTASHGSRGNKKADRYQHAAGMVEFYTEELPTKRFILSDHLGRVYEQEDGSLIRVIGGTVYYDTEGDGAQTDQPYFHIQHEDGEIEEHTPTSFDELVYEERLVVDEDDVFPEPPDRYTDQEFTVSTFQVKEDNTTGSSPEEP